MGNLNCIDHIKEKLKVKKIKIVKGVKSEFTTLPRLNLNKGNLYSSQYLQPKSKRYYKFGEIRKCQICKKKGETYKIFDGETHSKLGGKNSYYNVCFSCSNDLDYEIYI